MKKEEKIKIIDAKTGKECKPIYCRCGAEMTPHICSHIIDYSCPKIKWWMWLIPIIGFLYIVSKHSVNKAFYKIK